MTAGGMEFEGGAATLSSYNHRAPDMKQEIVFFHVKSKDHNPMTKVGYTSIKSGGKLIIYCTDEGPLDQQYRTMWLEWRKNNPQSKT